MEIQGTPPSEQYDLVRYIDLVEHIRAKETNPKLLVEAQQMGSQYVTKTEVDPTLSDFVSNKSISSWGTRYAGRDGKYATIGSTPVAQQFYPAEDFKQNLPIINNIIFGEKKLTTSKTELYKIDILKYNRFKNFGILIDGKVEVGSNKLIGLGAEYYYSNTKKFTDYNFFYGTNNTFNIAFSFATTAFFKPVYNEQIPDSRYIKIYGFIADDQKHGRDDIGYDVRCIFDVTAAKIPGS